MMRSILIAAALTAASCAVAAADETGSRSGTGPASRSFGPVQPIPETQKARLDKLFVELKRATSEADAGLVADQIRAEWRNSGSATIDLMMQWVADAEKKQNFAAALDFLDQVTVLAPDYAEGWNQRATVHFVMHDYARSMADIERTLALEPRHFGALAGLGAILQARGKKALALKAYERLLAVYPMLRQAQDADRKSVV